MKPSTFTAQTVSSNEMAALIVKHITLNNQRTSIALEPVFWNAIEQLPGESDIRSWTTGQLTNKAEDATRASWIRQRVLAFLITRSNRICFGTGPARSEQFSSPISNWVFYVLGGNTARDKKSFIESDIELSSRSRVHTNVTEKKGL